MLCIDQWVTVGTAQVCCGAVPALPAEPLEVPQDSRQQAVRVHARDASRRAGGQACDMLHVHCGSVVHPSYRICTQAEDAAADVQDMACETFLKICHKCKRKFVVIQVPFAPMSPASAGSGPAL